MKPTDVVSPADTAEEKGSLGTPPVKEEDPFGEALLIILPDRTQPPVDTSHVPRDGDITGAEEASPGDSYLNPQPPLWMSQPVERAIKIEEPEEEGVTEEGGPSATAIVKEVGTPLFLLPNKTPSQWDESQISHAGDRTAAEYARRGESSLYQQPPLFINTPQSSEGAIKKEEPEEDDVMGEGGRDIFDSNNFSDSRSGMEEESQMTEAHGLDTRTKEKKHPLKRKARKSDGKKTSGKGDGKKKTLDKDVFNDPFPFLFLKQNLAVTGMANSEMMDLDGSDSSSGTDLGSEYDDPTTKKPIEYDESPAKKKSIRTHRQPLQRQKKRPLKSKASKTLPMGTQSERKEDEESAKDGEAAEDSNSVVTDNDRACKLCGEEARDLYTHVTKKHLTQPLYVCLECSYGSPVHSNVKQHITRKHPNAATKMPVCNSVKLTADIQRLTARCFPNRKLQRGQTNRMNRLWQCKLCHVEMLHGGRQSHVYTHHLKLGALFRCPLCSFSSGNGMMRVTEHLKWTHKKEFGKVQPISHEAKHKKEIIAMNEKCFPGWRRKNIGGVETRKGRALTGGTAELETKDEGEEAKEAEMGSESSSGSNWDTEWKGAPRKEETQLGKIPHKRMKTRAEGEEEMEEGEGGASGSGLH